MTKLVFVEPSGYRREVDAASGQSVMRAATGAGVKGIVGECGGCAICMTCHAYVEEGRLRELPLPTATEQVLIDNLDEGRPNSRLTCQIVVTPEMEGMEFTLPRFQGG